MSCCGTSEKEGEVGWESERKGKRDLEGLVKGRGERRKT